MRIVAAVFVAILMTMALAACGSADSASSETSGTATGAVTSGTPSASATPPAPVETVLEVPRTFEIDENATPQFFQDALKEKMPLVVIFYSDDSISKEVLASVNQVYNDDKYSGVVKFLFLKIDDEEASDQALDESEKSRREETIELAKEFGVGFVPHTAVLDRNGTVVFEKKGFFETKVFEQAVYSASNK